MTPILFNDAVSTASLSHEISFMYILIFKESGTNK